jgi:hypothetical protein
MNTAHNDNYDDIQTALADLGNINTTLNGGLTATHEATADSLCKRPDSTADWMEFEQVECNKLTAVAPLPDITLYGRGAICYVPQNNANQNIYGVYRFGKNVDLLGDFDADGPGDGLFMNRNNNTLKLEVSKTAPSLYIKGEKANTGDFIRCENEYGTIIFNLTNDGLFQHGHHLIDSTTNLGDSENHSGLFEPTSIYIGAIRLSVVSGSIQQSILNRIPSVLAASPYSISNSDLSGRTYDQLSIRQWMVLARNKVSDRNLKARDIFTDAADWTLLGQHHSSSLTSSAQVQLDSITTDVTDLETLTTNINSDQTTLESTVISHNTRITTLESGGTTSIDHAQIVWVDSGRVDVYTEDGSQGKPYKTLAAAFTAKISTNGVTTSYVFKLRTGTYSVGSGVSITRGTKEQGFTIQGEGPALTTIECTDITTDCLFFRKFTDITMKDLKISTAKYGFYPRECNSVTLDNVHFEKCGSTSVNGNHDFTNTQVEQANVWASSTTSDGGACRIRDIDQVNLQNCYVYRCLRGLRVQDSGNSDLPSLIQNCRTHQTMESGIYLASGSYQFDDNAVYGCRNITISGNNIFEAFNNGLLNIGSKQCHFIANTVTRSANAAIQQYSSVDCTYSGNVMHDCNLLTFNGLGVLGDAYSTINITGNTGITANSGTYICALTDNTATKCNQGRAASIVGVQILATGVTYPAGYDIVFDGNMVDAPMSNPESVDIVSRHYRIGEVDSLLADKAPFPNQTTSTPLAWTSHGQTLATTLNTRNGKIRVSCQFIVGNGQYCTITLTNNVITADSIVLFGTYKHPGHIGAYIVQRPQHATTGEFVFKLASSEALDLSGNNQVSIDINFQVL